MGTLYEVSGTLGSITKQLEVKGDIISVTLAAATDNYNPAGLATANIILIDLSAGTIELSGITKPAAGVNKVIWIFNIFEGGGNNHVKLLHNDVASSVGNRFFLKDNNDKDLKKGEGGGLWYDHSFDSGNGIWRAMTRIG